MSTEGTHPLARESEAPGGERPTSVRYLVLTALALCASSAYLTRVCLSPATTTIQAEFRLDSQEMGLILSAFSLGYMWFQVPGGWLGNWLGARVVLSALSILWSLCVVWSSQSATPDSLYWSRVVYGVVQAGLVPCAAKVLGDWFPGRRRGMASAVLTSCMSLGAACANGLASELLPWVGWRSMFLIFSTVGVGWSVVFFFWFRNRPQDHTWTNLAERNLIAQGNTQVESRRASGATRLGLVALAMLTSSSLWMNCCQSYFRAFGYEFFVTWFPAFLEKGRGVTLTNSTLMTMLPLLSVVAGSLVGGMLIDVLLVKTNSKWISRSLTAAVALGACCACMLAASRVTEPMLALILISLGTFLSGIASPCAWAATLDISGRHAAVTFGIMNMVGNLGSIGSPRAVGYLIARDDRDPLAWTHVLWLFAAVYACAAVFWLLLNPSRSAVEGRPRKLADDEHEVLA